MRWAVKEYLERSGKTPYSLWKASGLSRTTVYAITGGQMNGVEFDTLAKVLQGLEKITGSKVGVQDVLEVSE